MWGYVHMTIGAPRVQKKANLLELEWWLWASQVSVKETVNMCLFCRTLKSYVDDKEYKSLFFSTF